VRVMKGIVGKFSSLGKPFEERGKDCSIEKARKAVENLKKKNT